MRSRLNFFSFFLLLLLIEATFGKNEIVSELIRELDLAGMINARVKSRGRYGRTKFIKMNIPLENVGSYLEKETQLNDLINYQPVSVGRKQNQGMNRFF